MDPEELNTSLHSSTTPVISSEFRRFGSHPLSSQSRNQARTALSALLIGLSRSSVRQRKLWRLLLLPAINNHLLPSADQHGFRPGHSTTSALLQLTSDIATGFNQRKTPHHTVCVTVDLTTAFDTVNHNVPLSKIVRSTLPEATCRWLSNYLRGSQSVTGCRGVLNYRPPPISEEEIYLTRRQRATLSQLRSGHCKLLNSYKNRLKQTDSSSCPDCGMDPQDVPHLFNCTAHPTTLTPESLWDRTVKTIQELSFLYPENLD